MIRENLLILFLLLANNYLHANEAPQIVYRNEPIQVQLRVGSERRFVLTSAASVKVGIPESLRNKLSVTTIGSQIWLLANQSFESEKIIFQTPDAKIVLELSAAPIYPIGEPILLSSESDIISPQVSAADSNCDIGIVKLARYALQWAYAPRHLLSGNPCITAINYPKGLIDIMNCLRVNEAICGGGVVAKPIAAWRTAKLYATLLELKNTLQTSIALDPRAIAGNFKAAALAHHKLEAAHTAKSTTALVVIGDKPISRSIPKERWLDKWLDKPLAEKHTPDTVTSR